MELEGGARIWNRPVRVKDTNRGGYSAGGDIILLALSLFAIVRVCSRHLHVSRAPRVQVKSHFPSAERGTRVARGERPI
jgi:hypothetical protein